MSTPAEPLAASSPPPETAKPPVTRGRKRAFTIFFIVLACAAAAGLFYWLHSRNFESTDDAQVDAHLNAISARVDGAIEKVYVEDNQIVRAGDPLVDLDPRDLQVSLAQALAQLAQSHSLVLAEQPNVPITQVENFTSVSTGEAEILNATAALRAAERDRETAEAKVAEAEANNAKAQGDLARYQLLIAKEEISQQEFDQAAATARAQAAALAGSRSSLSSSSQLVDQRRAQLAQAQSRLAQSQSTGPQQLALRRATIVSQQASAKTAQVQVDQARLKLSYTRIAAPVPGIVMKRSAELGAHISAGQPLLTIAQIDDLWVTANFKETQLRNLRPQQPVTLHVDSLKQDFDGYVENIGGATGAVASVLPPENATGNYVKVVQRIPVRLRFKKDQQGLRRLRPGMSVVPTVRIGG
jgi:membrane fusion protein (multidrug efflux system)